MVADYPLQVRTICAIANIRQQKFARSGPDTLPLPDDSRIGVNSLRRMFASARSAGAERGIVAVTIDDPTG